MTLVGVFDAFSALLATKWFEGIFCSGFGFAASTYGLPDIGFVNWRDMVDFASRLKCMLPNTFILVDIDDGFGDENIAANTVRHLECNQVSAVMIEDQQRPRKCGHLEKKQILPIDQFLNKLSKVLSNRNKLFIIARTDAEDSSECIDRAHAYYEKGADGVMIEAVQSLEDINKLNKLVDCPIMVSQIFGGKTPNWSLKELEDSGVSIVCYSTPCLFAAQYGVERYLKDLSRLGKLPSNSTVTLDQCNDILFKN